MSMSYSNNWYTNNCDKIIEMVADAETMEFCQADFDRVERELFSLEYDRVRKQNSLLKEGVEFYGESDNYMDLYYDSWGLIEESEMDTCGKKARETLKQIEEMES